LSTNVKKVIVQPKIKKNAIAPDFELVDTQGRTVRLSEVRDRKIVVLVLMRGFI